MYKSTLFLFNKTLRDQFKISSQNILYNIQLDITNEIYKIIRKSTMMMVYMFFFFNTRSKYEKEEKHK